MNYYNKKVATKVEKPKTVDKETIEQLAKVNEFAETVGGLSKLSTLCAALKRINDQIPGVVNEEEEDEDDE